MPNHYGGDLLDTMGISGRSRVRTEFLHFVVVPSAPPHPVQLDRQFPGHRDLGDLSPTPHGEVKELATTLRLAAHRDLGSFHQQEAQQSGCGTSHFSLKCYPPGRSINGKEKE